ncbi:MAG: phage/plasmid primase, P4 family [Chlamydiota bacterium]
MSFIINEFKPNSQEQYEELARVMIVRFPHKLGHGIKNRLKALGCVWNSMFQGWVCDSLNQEEVQKALEAANLQCDIQIKSLPKGIIPTNPKIAGRETRLEILEKEIHQEEMELLKDVCTYDLLLRPEDFAQAPLKEEKPNFKFQQEQAFHDRWNALQKKKEEVAMLRQELNHLHADLGEKTFEANAPLLIAEALIKAHFLYDGLPILQYCSDTFWQWDGSKYLEIHKNAIRKVVYDFLRDAKQITDTGSIEGFNPNKFKVDQIIDALKAIRHQDHHPASRAIWLDGRNDPDPQYLISFQNGLLNVQDWLKDPLTPLIPHTPLFLNVNALTFDFDPNASEPQEWLKFLNSIWSEDKESQDTLQEWFGYLLGYDTSQQKILLIIGPPRSGKGTIGRVLTEFLGIFNVVGPTLSSLGGAFGLQPLLNKMLATISDARLNSRGNNSLIIERLLSISGEDSLTIDRKFRPPITVQLPTRIAIMSNELPDLRDASGAIAKRFIVLRLIKSFLGQEDIGLLVRLRKELPSILLWAIQGLARLKERGKFIQPSSSAQAIEELEAMTSPVKAFLMEMCEIKPYVRVKIPVLFKAWCDWCEMTGYHTGNRLLA